MELRLEFTVEPFHSGHPGPHVLAALDEARRSGLDPEMGPFGTTVEGDAAAIIAGLAAIVTAARRRRRHPRGAGRDPQRRRARDRHFSTPSRSLRVHGLLDRLIAEVERQLGGRLSELSREAKQQAVKLLDERGAFNLRRSMEDVADALGVSRITVYNYLNAVTPRDRPRP